MSPTNLTRTVLLSALLSLSGLLSGCSLLDWEGLPRDKALALALSGGEDYALLFTLPPERRADLADADAPPTAVIGQITSSPGITWDPPGPPPDAGIPWRHFPGAG